MKLVIHYAINLRSLTEEDKELLRDCSIWCDWGDENTLLRAQSITLDCNIMEEVLDVIYWGTEGIILLERYEAGRYKLKMC